MPAAIGLRFYKLVARRLRDREKETVSPADLNVSVPDFLGKFVMDRSDEDAVSSAEKERSYYFDPIETYGIGCVRGHVHYGTFGYESRIKDLKSKKVAYNRKSSDVEEIPLYFDFWCPAREDFAMISLQSYGIRSCVQLVLHEIQKQFEALNPGFRLHINKLMGNDSPRTLFADAPVKKLTLIRHNAYSDRFSTYRPGKPAKPVDMELSYKAKRGGALGTLRDMSGALSETESGIFTFEGGEFHEATAEVLIGKRRRPVGIIGPNSDTGTIDVSETVTYAASGHPTYDSVRVQSDLIMQDFFKRLKDV